MVSFTNFINKKNGFTLIEVLVTLGITMLLASILVFNGRSGNRTLEVKRAAQEMVADIRLAQNLALSAREEDCQGALNPNDAPAYGIYLDSDPENPGAYVIYGDCVGNKEFQGGQGDPSNPQGGDDEIKEILMENVSISLLQTGSGVRSDISVLYEPPVPTTRIFPNGSAFTITLRHLDDATKCLRVQGNNRGSVWINETACPSP